MKNLLIIANSGRMLAQFAANLNVQSLVIDCFSDVDTGKLALQCVRVDSLSLVHVKTAIFSLMAKYSVSHVVYGSGLECYPATLEFLHQNLSVLGNTPDTF